MKNVEIKRVLFVCVENSCRSQLAEAISNHLFSNHLKAFSAGSKPSGKVEAMTTYKNGILLLADNENFGSSRYFISISKLL